MSFEGLGVADDAVGLDGDGVVGPIDNFKVVGMMWVGKGDDAIG